MKLARGFLGNRVPGAGLTAVVAGDPAPLAEGLLVAGEGTGQDLGAGNDLAEARIEILAADDPEAGGHGIATFVHLQRNWSSSVEPAIAGAPDFQDQTDRKSVV